MCIVNKATLHFPYEKLPEKEQWQPTGGRQRLPRGPAQPIDRSVSPTGEPILGKPQQFFSVSGPRGGKASMHEGFVMGDGLLLRAGGIPHRAEYKRTTRACWQRAQLIALQRFRKRRARRVTHCDNTADFA